MSFSLDDPKKVCIVTDSDLFVASFQVKNLTGDWGHIQNFNSVAFDGNAVFDNRKYPFMLVGLHNTPTRAQTSFQLQILPKRRKRSCLPTNGVKQARRFAITEQQKAKP